MKNNRCFLTVLWCSGLLLLDVGMAQAQSSVTVYGLMETGLRYSTNQNAAGGGLMQMGDGVLNPSRIGLTGTEDLGSGLKAFFTLEGGLYVKNGKSVNAAFGTLNNDNANEERLFGRSSFVGLSGDFGAISLGRQYTTAMLSACTADPICGGGMVVYSPYLLYTSLRQDNMLSYQKALGPIMFSAHYTFGEQAADSSAHSGYGLGLGYVNGPLSLNGAYQENNLPSIAKSKVSTLNSAYKIGAAQLMLGYVRNALSHGVSQKNHVFYGGVVYTASSAWTLTATAHYDKQQNTDGEHVLLVGIADYAFSKRTSAYLEMDYHKYKKAMLPFGGGGPDRQAGATLGLRHKF